MNIITELYERWTRTQLTQVNIEEKEAFEFNRGLTTSVVDPMQNMIKIFKSSSLFILDQTGIEMFGPGSVKPNKVYF